MEVGVHLNWFAALVNHGNKKVNARLDAEIDFTEYTRKDVMIGGDAFSASESDDARAFEGIFDGQEHTINIGYNVSYDGVALFKVISNATVKNLCVKGAIESTQRFIGGLVFVTRGASLIENVVVAVDITGSYPGDATHGGICSVAHESPIFRNCAFVGSMNAPYCEGTAAIIGYAHGEVETIIENCYVAPSTFLLTGNSTVIARHVRNIVNCFYTSNITDFWENAATVVEPQSLASGELCYKINEGGETDAWRQNISSDAYSMPFASHQMVYANGSLRMPASVPGWGLTTPRSRTATALPPASTEPAFGEKMRCRARICIRLKVFRVKPLQRR